VAKKICILGSNSGHNLGDVAILYSIITNILKLAPETTFEIPAHRRGHIENRFSTDSVRFVQLQRARFSLICLNTLKSILRSDVILITDGIIFDVGLFKPRFNWLLSLIFVVPFAKLCRKKVVGFLLEIGPLYTTTGRLFAQLVCALSDEMMVREPHSVAALKRIGAAKTPAAVYGDAAFITEPVPEARAREILAEINISSEERAVGININMYFDFWLRPGEQGLDRKKFIKAFAAGIDLIIEKQQCRVFLLITQSADIRAAKALLAASRHAASLSLINCDRHTPAELQLIISRFNVFVGMRLHSLIFASSVNTPCIGMVYSPRVRNLMELLGQKDLKIELADLTGPLLYEKVSWCLENEADLKENLRRRTDIVREKTRAGFESFARRYLAD